LTLGHQLVEPWHPAVTGRNTSPLKIHTFTPMVPYVVWAVACVVDVSADRKQHRPSRLFATRDLAAAQAAAPQSGYVGAQSQRGVTAFFMAARTPRASATAAPRSRTPTARQLGMDDLLDVEVDLLVGALQCS
jgi:hypothetical protein